MLLSPCCPQANAIIECGLKPQHTRTAGPALEKDKIPGLDLALAGGDSFDLGALSARVLDVGGGASKLQSIASCLLLCDCI